VAALPGTISTILGLEKAMEYFTVLLSIANGNKAAILSRNTNTTISVARGAVGAPAPPQGGEKIRLNLDEEFASAPPSPGRVNF